MRKEGKEISKAFKSWIAVAVSDSFSEISNMDFAWRLEYYKSRLAVRIAASFKIRYLVPQQKSTKKQI